MPNDKRLYLDMSKEKAHLLHAVSFYSRPKTAASTMKVIPSAFSSPFLFRPSLDQEDEMTLENRIVKNS